MRMKSLMSVFAIVAAMGLAASAFAQGPPPPPPGPGGPGPGMGPGEPPGPPPTAEDVFKEIDTSGDGVITPDEFAAWFKPPMGPGPGMGGPGMGGPGPGPGMGGPGMGGPGPGPGMGGPGMGGPGMGGPGPGPGMGGPGPGMGGPGPGPGGEPGDKPEPPECSEDVRNSELLPQATDVMASTGKAGNAIFRTVCSTAPYNENAIVLPTGRQAVDFGVEAITKNKVFFGIRAEGGPNIWDVTMGKAAFHALVLEDVGISPTGKYTIYLDPTKSDPGARVTVRFIDTPK